MNAFHLVWFVPVVFFFGFFLGRLTMKDRRPTIRAAVDPAGYYGHAELYHDPGDPLGIYHLRPVSESHNQITPHQEAMIRDISRKGWNGAE